MSVQQRLCILGSTGSIGVSTLDVVARHPDRFSVHALSAHSRIESLAEQAARHAARVVIVPDDAARARFVAAWPAGRRMPSSRAKAAPPDLPACWLRLPTPGCERRWGWMSTAASF